MIRPRRGVLLAGFGLMVVRSLCGLVLPWSTRRLIDDVIVKGNMDVLNMLVLGVLAATIIQGIASFSLTQLVSKAAQRLIAELRRLGRPMQQIDIQIAAIAFSLGSCIVVNGDSDHGALLVRRS